MKTLVIDLHKAFESRTRLHIMSVLAVNDMLDFNSLKNYLNITDGNLASNIKVLEKEAFIHFKKKFAGKPNIKYFMTKKGRKAFDDHLKALEQLINLQRQIWIQKQ